MAVDGSLKFDTKIDDSGFSDGVSRLSSMAAKGLAAISGAVAGMSAYAIKVGSNFEAGMSEVSAISVATGEDLEMLTNKAKEMGIQTKFSATEASEAMQYMAMAGWKAADMAEGISGIMDLAAASGEDLASVSDIVTDALTAFGLQASDSGHFADVLAKAASNSNTNVGMMGATFKYAAPLAGTLGYSIEDTAVAIGLMANAGIKGEQAGTSMRAMLTRLANPTDEVAGAMETLGIEIANADGSIKPLNKTMKDLRKAFSKLTDEQKAQYASSLAGQEAMSGFLAIVNASDGDFDNLSEAINNAEGAASEMAETMNDNLKGKVTLLGSSLEGVGIAAYEKFERPLKNAVDGAIDKVNDLSTSMASGELSDSMDTVAEGLGSIVDTTLDLATGAIPLVIDGFAFVVDHGGDVVAILAGIGTAMITQKTVVPMVNAFHTAMTAVDAYNVKLLASSAAGIKFNGSLTLGQVAVGLFTGKVTLATAATVAWNAACAALGGPIGVIITAVAALGAGVGMLVLSMSDEVDEHKHIMEAIEEEKNSRQELIDQQKEQLEANLSEINNVQNLNAELKTLVDENGYVREGYEARAGFILNELNNAIGTELTLNGNLVEGYSELSGSIDDMLAKKKAEIILEAQLPAYKEAVTKSIEAQTKANELAMQLSDLKMQKQAKEAELEAKYGKNWHEEAFKRQDRLLTEWSFLEADTTKKQKEYDAQNEIVEGYYDDITSYETNAARIATGNAEEIAKVETSIVTSKSTTTSEKLKLMEQQKAAEEKQLEYLKNKYKDSNDEIELQQIESQERKIENTQKEIDAMTSTVEEKRGEYAKAFTDNIVAGIQAIKDKYSDTKNAGNELAQEGVEGAKEGSAGFEGVGKNSAEGFANGMTLPEALSSVISSARSMMQTALKAAKDEGVIRSPSHVFRDEVGYMAGAGLAVGMDKSEGLIAKSARSMVQSALDETSHMKKLMQDDIVVDFSASFDSMRGVAIQHATTMPFSASNNVYNSCENNTDPIDYDKLGRSVAKAISEEGLEMKVNNREFARLAKEWK